MSFYRAILVLAAFGAIVGGLDSLCGDRLGLGKKFREGFEMMGPLALSMAGVIVMAPVLAEWLQPALIPAFRWIHADPALVGALIANDMGGYPLAMMLAESEEMGLLAGSVIASMLGCTLTYSIPLGLGIIDREHSGDFVRGLLIGLTTIPIGGVIGGLAAGFDPAAVLINNIPIAVVSVGLAVGFRLWPSVVQQITGGFCALIRWIAVLGVAAGAFTRLTGWTVPLLEQAAPIMDAFSVVAEITVVLIGILPMLELLTRVLRRPLNALGRLLGINSVAASGLIYTLANPLPVFGMLREMDGRGRVVNAAWLVTAAAALGDHLGFTAGVAPGMVAPMLAGKLAGGVCAILLALLSMRGGREKAG